MTGHRSAVALCLLFALSISAMAAQTAVAATPGGTTALTCKKKAEAGGAGFSKSHCKAADAVEAGAEYEHAAFSAPTEVEVSNKNTAGEPQTATIRGVVSSTTVEVQATEVTGTGTVSNQLTTRGEHFIQGEAALTYGNATVAAPAGKGCKVKGGKVVTESLAVTSSEQGDTLRFSPAKGTLFASFQIEGCSITALNGTYKVVGSVKCPPDGATITCTGASTTEQGTFEMHNHMAEIESVLTVSGRNGALGETEYTPLSATTTAISSGPATGTTTFTCEKRPEPGGAGFSEEHCRADHAVESGAEYEHAEAPEYTTTEVSGSGGPITFKGSFSGVEYEFEAAEAVAKGWTENVRTTGGEHFAYGEGTITFSGLKVNKPAGKGCKFKSESLTTQSLMASTAGIGMEVKVDPVEGTVLAEFVIECEIANFVTGTYKVEGSVKCPPEGATVTCSEASVTGQSTLKARGVKVGVAGSLTLSGRNPALKEVSYTPLSVTTVSTP